VVAYFEIPSCSRLKELKEATRNDREDIKSLWNPIKYIRNKNKFPYLTRSEVWTGGGTKFMAGDSCGHVMNGGR
jgi:hypothetical protein